MGDINPAKMPKGKTVIRKDDPNKVELFAKGGDVWDKPRPKGLGASKALTPAKKAAAKKSAKAAGRPYPNLVDNMRMAKK